MWFTFSVLATLLWGTADLFYKKGNDELNKYSHLKTSVIVGFVMGIHALSTLIFKDVGYNPINLLIYLPVAAMYILSMTIGYFGLKYLDLSISSPVQNSSGAVAFLLCLFFVASERKEILKLPVIVAVILICVGVFLLGVFEKGKPEKSKSEKIGIIAFLMPVLYCIIDSLGTFLDGYYLDVDVISDSPLKNVTESTLSDVANISYELTFLFVAVVLYVYIRFIKKEKFGNIREQKFRLGAALFETAGQFFYNRAITGNATIAIPMISSYCIVSVVLSAIILKEKLLPKQYLTVLVVVIGIVILGVYDI